VAGPALLPRLASHPRALGPAERLRRRRWTGRGTGRAGSPPPPPLAGPQRPSCGGGMLRHGRMTLRVWQEWAGGENRMTIRVGQAADLKAGGGVHCARSRTRVSCLTTALACRLAAGYHDGRGQGAACERRCGSRPAGCSRAGPAFRRTASVPILVRRSPPGHFTPAAVSTTQGIIGPRICKRRGPSDGPSLHV
jgi:hypothetical protein